MKEMVQYTDGTGSSVGKQPQIGASASFSSYGGTGRVAAIAAGSLYAAEYYGPNAIVGRSYSDIGTKWPAPPPSSSSAGSSTVSTYTNNSSSWSPTSSSSSSGIPNSGPWNLRVDPEVKRKSRLASYKAIAFEGKVKASVRRSFRWIKSKYIDMVHGNT